MFASAIEVREMLYRAGITTALSDREIEECLEFESGLSHRSVLVIGKCGAGKDTVGGMIRELYGHETDSMAYILKIVALIAFGAEKKDRELLQALSRARDLLPSVYLDNVWRRIIQRRKLAQTQTSVREFHSPQDVRSFIKEMMFPHSPEIGIGDIDGMLQHVYDKRFGDGKAWWSLFKPRKLEQTLRPIPGPVVLTDCRFPNEFFLGFGLGLQPVRVLCDEKTRIHRLKLRDGQVDPATFLHPSETALDFLWEDEAYFNVAKSIVDLDNNGTMEQLKQQVQALCIERAA